MDFKGITMALEDISNISSGNEKLAWLREHDDPDLKELFRWYFDNSYPTGISEKKYSRGISGNAFVKDGVTFHDVIEYLKVHNTGKDSDIDWCLTVRDGLCSTDGERECYRKLVTKNYPMGIDSKTINKVWKNIVPTFDVCLCDKYYDRPGLVDGTREFAISTKIDGCRCIAIKEDGRVRLISRQGKPWLGCVEIEDAIRELPGDNFVLDGEITVKNFMKYPSKDTYKMTTKIVSTKDEVKRGVCLNAFDYMELKDWNNKKCTKPYHERRTELYELFRENRSDALYRLPDIYVGKDVSMIEQLMKGPVRTEDWEGLVIKFTDSLYEWKRSKNWLKVKAFLEMDLIVRGYEEGQNSNTGKLGALICDIEHPEMGHIEAKVGGGYSNDERIRFWEMRDELIGRTISVQYFEQTVNTTTGTKSLRFPVFLELKEEGQEPNN